METVWNFFLNHWPLAGFLPGSTNYGYKTHSPGTELSDQSFFQKQGHRSNTHTENLVTTSTKGSCVLRDYEVYLFPLRFFPTPDGNKGIFLLPKFNLLSMMPRASGKSGKILLWSHGTWYNQVLYRKYFLVYRLAAVLLSCLQTKLID